MAIFDFFEKNTEKSLDKTKKITIVFKKTSFKKSLSLGF